MTTPTFTGVVETYRRAFHTHGDSPASVLWPKGRQAARFGALTREFRDSPASVLDFGCGLAHFKQFLSERFDRFSYCGADIVSEFIEANRARYPESEFILLEDVSAIGRSFDYVVLSGVFNIIYNHSEEEHRALVRRTLKHLFLHTRRVLAVDFMTDQVDYRQDGAYHQNIDDIFRFARTELSERIMIDQTYLPYEFCVTIMKPEA